jgi:hypothetical protein
MNSATVDAESKLLFITDAGTGAFTITSGLLSKTPHFGHL